MYCVKQLCLTLELFQISNLGIVRDLNGEIIFFMGREIVSPV